MSLRWCGCGLIVLISIMTIACGRGDEAAGLPPQQWGNVGITVESRPVLPRIGMNEFLVIATESSGRPVWNMMVSLRTASEDDWRQAIQDGESGVYRRALPLSSGQQTLYVNLRRAGEETVLEFPLRVQ
jgi:hypothetical protein